ncbi:GNAT family N-acetyltransferase [Mesorhizobium sp.]|uniref:GNAT family N-acetyltransferase n=1 Tax=Mesorhizobium sp. TaxID=1871066 RepID=UPI000FE575E0|nr:GNAT family N-acetyltransferase [Mesorhizobium sp.]RWO80993.1 MAG: GNAT family N-acetyltransferase [Mesorhizobium sp.]RWQ53900.1 MAG: GNAT family N-acetyltransferase [Mesorhizobium sp.]
MTPGLSRNDYFRVEVIDRPAEFPRLAIEWDELAKGAADLAVFRSHEWVSRCWQRHQTMHGRSMHIVVIRDGGELVLAAPFVRIADWYGTATLVWLDSMTPLYNDILVVHDQRSDALKQALRRYIQRQWSIRALKLNCVREDAEIAPLLNKVGASRTWETAASALDISSFASRDDFLASQSSKARYNLRRYIRQMEREGPVRFREIASARELETSVRWIFAHKRKWVEARFGAANWIAAPGAEEMFLDVSTFESSRGRASVMALETKQEIIAAVLLFRCGGTVFLSKLAYDPGWRKVSPGWVLLMHIIGEACATGIRSVDFMIGRDAWKDRFGVQSVAVSNYRLRNGFWP